MASYPVRLHTLVNFGQMISCIVPDFWKSIGIYAMVAAPIGFFGEINMAPFRWFQVIHTEAYAGISYMIFLAFIAFVVNLLNFLFTRHDHDIKAERATSIFTDKFVLQKLLWILVLVIIMVVDTIGFHFISYAYGWLFGIVVGCLGLGEFIVLFATAIIVHVMHIRKLEEGIEKERPVGFAQTYNPYNIRSYGVWFPELFIFSIQPFLAKLSLILSFLGFCTNPYFIFHPIISWRILATERLSLLIFFGCYITLEIIFMLLKLLFKLVFKFFPERIRLAPESRSQLDMGYRILGTNPALVQSNF